MIRMRAAAGAAALVLAAGGAWAWGATAQTPAAGGSAVCAAPSSPDQTAAVLAACDGAVAAAPGAAAPRLERARVLVALREYAKATPDLDLLIEQDPRNHEALYLRSVSHAWQRRLPQAKVDLETALLIQPRSLDYLLFAAELAKATGETDKVLAYYDRALAVSPTSVPTLMAKGHVLYSRNDYQGALKVFDAAVRAGPDQAQPLHWRGHTYQALKDHAKAERDFAAAVAIAPGSADLLSDRGDSLLHLGRKADAMASYDLAVRSNPTFARGVRSRGILRFDTGDLWGAREDFEDVFKLTGSDRDAGFLDTAEQKLEQRYAAPLIEARAAVAKADPGGVSCDSGLPTRSDYHQALGPAAGDVATAEAALTKTALERYRKCLQSARSTGTAATDRLPQLRLEVADKLAAQTALTEAFKAECAKRPRAREFCETLLPRITEGAAKVRADLKAVEAASIGRSAGVAELETAAQQRVAAAVTAARTAFAADAGARFRSSVNLADLEQKVRLIQNGQVETIYQACGSFHLWVPKSDAELARVNAELSAHRSCLDNLQSRVSSRSWEYQSAQYVIADAVDVAQRYKAFRCSVRPGTGCVDDALWTRVAQLATPAVRDRASSMAKASGQVPDQVSAELVRINDAVKRYNRETAQHNTWVGISNALSAFAAGYNAAAPDYTRQSTTTTVRGF